jgi:tetratricopeptide (TPR) repeat protein
MPRTARGPIGIGLMIAACAQACASGGARPRLDRELSMHRSFGQTVEAQDPALANALIGLRLAPSAERHRAVAAEYRRLRVDDAAFDHLTAAMRLNPTDAAAYDQRARIWRDWGFPQLGMTDAARAVYFAPASAEAHNTRGTLLAAIGEIDLAREEFRTALKLDQDATFAARNLCLLESRTGRAGGQTETCDARRPR